MFTTPCDIRVLKGGKVELLSPLIFKHKNIEIVLHIGFIWDLASIPKGLHDIMGDPFDYVMESALHDALYGTALFTREESDLYFYLALRSGGKYKDSVGKVKAKALHAGVRIGGEPHYRTGSISKAREFVSIKILDNKTEG